MLKGDVKEEAEKGVKLKMHQRCHSNLNISQSLFVCHYVPETLSKQLQEVME